MLSPERPWNNEEDSVKKLARTIAENLQCDVEWLQVIKRHLLPKQYNLYYKSSLIFVEVIAWGDINLYLGINPASITDTLNLSRN